MFFKNLFRSFKMGLRILRNTLLRPFRAGYFRLKRSTDITRKIATKAPELGKSVRKVKLKPTRREDYVETKGAYVAKSFILVGVLAAVLLGAFIYFIAWPTARSWWFTAKLWQQDEAIAAYNGRVWLYEDESKDARVFKGKLEDGKKTGDGVEYYLNGNEKYRGAFQGGLYHGQGAIYNDHNTLIYEGGFKEGLYDGTGREYGHGILLYEGGFLGGERNGKGTLYDEKGEPFYVGGFVDGILEGEGEFYSEGILCYKGGVSSGEYSGSGKEYRDDGKTVAYSGMFFGGLRSGYGVSYFTNGQIEYQGNFDLGKYSGSGLLFHSNGQMRYNGSFLLGEFSGDGTLYDENGERLYKGGFEGGLYNGSGTLYSDAGSVLYEGGFLDSQYDGEGKLYLDVKRRIEGPFTKGELQGAARLYVNGQLYYEGEFNTDLFMHGEGKRYSSDGRVIYSGRFSNGGIDGTGLMDMALEEARQFFADARTVDVETDIGLVVKNLDLGAALFASYQTEEQQPIIHRLYQYDWLGTPVACGEYPPLEGDRALKRASNSVENLLNEPLPTIGYGASVTLQNCYFHIWGVNEKSGIAISRYMSKTPLPSNGIPPSKLNENIESNEEPGSE